jgi:hypothetical protein
MQVRVLLLAQPSTALPLFLSSWFHDAQTLPLPACGFGVLSPGAFLLHPSISPYTLGFTSTDTSITLHVTC